jgi:hypothetical protein
MDPVVKVTCNYVKKISRRMNKTEKTPEFFFFFLSKKPQMVTWGPYSSSVVVADNSSLGCSSTNELILPVFQKNAEL